VSWFDPGWQQRATWSLYRPSPHLGWEENWKKKAKLVGRDKGSPTEQQRKKTVTTTILIRIYKNNNTYRATVSLSNAPRAPKPSLTFPWPASPLRTQHECTWYRISHLYDQFGSAHPDVSSPGFL